MINQSGNGKKNKTYGVVNTSKEKAEITLNLISRCTAAYNGFPGVFCVFFLLQSIPLSFIC